MAKISGAGSSLDIRLGQFPKTKVPELNRELQPIYASIHILSQYLDILRDSFEGDDSQDPSETLRFRRIFYATAGQNITAGAICCPIGSNQVVNGVIADPTNFSYDDTGAFPLGITGTRGMWGLQIQPVFYIALETVNAGQQVKLGIPVGVLKLPGAVCGQIVFAAGYKGIGTHRNSGSPTEVITNLPFVGNGSLYLSNPVYRYQQVGAYRNYEGYWIVPPGTNDFLRNYFYPVAICIKDDFVLFNDRLLWPIPPAVVITN